MNYSRKKSRQSLLEALYVIKSITYLWQVQPLRGASQWPPPH